MLRVSPDTFKPVNNLICYKTGFDVGDKTRNTAIQLVLQYYCKKSCMFLVARFSAPLILSCGWFATLKSEHYVLVMRL